MALKLTKNSTIILTSIILVLSLALGFLIWRVNQEETTAPTESEASCPSGCFYHSGLSTCIGNGGCRDYSSCTSGSCGSLDTCYQGYCCDTCEGDGEGAFDCNEGSECSNKCYWPETAYCNRNHQCTCMNVSTQQQDPLWNPCTDDGPLCTPTCNPGDTTAECSARCSSCNNLYYVEKTCEPTPSCGDGTIDTGEECDPKASPAGCDIGMVCNASCLCETPPRCGDGTKDPGEGCDDGANNGKVCTPTYGSSCTYCSATCEPVTIKGDYCGDKKITSPEKCEPLATPTGCATGQLCNQSCLCETPPATCGDGKINGTGEECEPPGSVCTKESKPGVCSTSCKCTLDPYCGDGKLGTNEKCEVGDPTGTQCSWSACNQTACTCLPAGLNITKTVAESCIAEGTENPSAQLIYTITVRNTGSGKGQISKIEDVLDSKVLAKGITPTDIVGGGVYSSGKIVWSFSPALDIASGATQTYSYKLVIDKNSFGTYANTVTLTPVSGDTIQANASIKADCLAITPQTGIFDSTLGRISAGFVLLLVGGLVYSLPSGIFSLSGKENKFRYRVRFESKMFRK